MDHKIYELNGAEQVILEANCELLNNISKSKTMRQDALEQYPKDIEVLKGRKRDIIGNMATLFGLTRFQVINKVIAEGRK